MAEINKVIILIRLILSILSIISTTFLIILYILQFKAIYKEKEKKKKQLSLDQDISGIVYRLSRVEEEVNDEKGEVGLGCHFLLFLTISGFCTGAFDVFLFFFNFPDETQEKLNDYCQIAGYFTYFIQYMVVCWTTSLSLLFYYSVKQAVVNFNKAMTLSIIYSFVFSIILPLILIICNKLLNEDDSDYDNKYYYFNKTHCTWNYDINYSKENMYAGTIFEVLNGFFDIILLIKVIAFYKSKFQSVEGEKDKESIRTFLQSFRVFPSYIGFARGLKALNRLLDVFDVTNEIMAEILEYSSNIVYSSCGIVNSIGAYYFFKGALNYCCEGKDYTRESIFSEENSKEFCLSDFTDSSLNT